MTAGTTRSTAARRSNCSTARECSPRCTVRFVRSQAADLVPTPPRAILARMLANLEQGRFGTDPGNLATLCALHLAIPGVPVEQQVQLLRALARAGDPERVERAYVEVAAAAPEAIADELQTEVRLLRSRWN